MTTTRNKPVNPANKKPASKKRKKHVSNDDRTFNKNKSTRKRRKAESGDAFHIRTINDKTITKPDGQELPLKTASILNTDAIEGLSPERVKRHFVPDTPSNRPIKQVISRITTSPNGTETIGSPMAVDTPEGTRLFKRTDIGLIIEFSNYPQPDFGPQKILFDKALCIDFFNSDTYQNIQTVLKNIVQKEQEMIVTEALLQKAKRQLQQNGNQRSISQNALMVAQGVPEKHGSANNYTKAAIRHELLADTVKCEWLHLIAYMFKGNAAQDIQNLVAGNTYANTEMMAAEAAAKKLAKYYPQGIELSVIADIIPETHIAKRIYYRIATANFALNFKFNAFSTNKPLVSLASYVKNVVTACLEATEEKKASLLQTKKGAAEEKDDNKENSIVNNSIFRKPASQKPHSSKVTTTRKSLRTLKR